VSVGWHFQRGCKIVFVFAPRIPPNSGYTCSYNLFSKASTLPIMIIKTSVVDNIWDYVINSQLPKSQLVKKQLGKKSADTFLASRLLFKRYKKFKKWKISKWWLLCLVLSNWPLAVGSMKLTGENLKVAWVKFSTLS
jgi:hypothetical protein